MVDRLESITIKGYRGFSSPITISLAQPNGKAGSGLTLITGTNNSGKSSVAEVMRILARFHGVTFSEGKRNKKAGDRVELIFRNNNGAVKTIKTANHGGSESESENESVYPRVGHILVLPSRRYFDPYFGRGINDRRGYSSNFNENNFRSRSSDSFSGRLFHALKNKKAFDEELSKVVTNFPEWTIDQVDTGNHYLKIGFGSAIHSSDGLGEGLVSLLFIVDALYDSNPESIIVIDEPELSLHPSVLRKLTEYIGEKAKDRQIIISTHSPYFVDFSHLIAGAILHRLTKDEDEIRAYSLTGKTVTALSRLYNNLNNPHILGLEAREVFFLADRVVLVEGQEDVLLYKKILGQIGVALSGDFFGWGAGGADNIPVVADMLKDLGFKRVAAIVDKNKDGVETAFKQSCNSYQFHVSPADDVRTKSQNAKGLLDEKYQLRVEYRKEVESMFKKINKFFNA
jgi:predicted ATP-dependent endonuclease of OLD family